MRVAVYGGSFNPPHRAHALVAKWVLSSGTADAGWLVPVFRHAFEGLQGKTLAPFEQRICWCEALANEIGPSVVVSSVESVLPTPSFTIDTLRHFSETHPDHNFRLVIGADILDQVDGWKDWDRIVRDYSPIVVGREGYDSPSDVPCFPNVSSTEIRSRLKAGEDVSEFLTPEVSRLIGSNPPWSP